MFGRMESRKKNLIGEDSTNGRLLHEIEALSKALYLNNAPPKKALPATARSNQRSVSVGKTHFSEPRKTNPSRDFRENPTQKDKKSSSIWSWKPLKALSHIRHRRFSCRFSLHVHSIEGLPSEFDGVGLVVKWRRRDSGVETRAAKVFGGIAEFEEILTHKCSVYGSGNGVHHSAKYEAKHCLICAYIVGAPLLDLGKHRVDLTRFLPLTLEELEEEESSGKWTTSFKLSGKAKGAMLNVSFGFMVLRDNPPGCSVDKKMTPELSNSKPNTIVTVKSMSGHDRADNHAALRRVGSVPGADIAHQGQSCASFPSVGEVKILHEVLPSSKLEVLGSVDLGQEITNWKLDNGGFGGALVDSEVEHDGVFSDHALKSLIISGCPEDAHENDYYDTEFTVIDQGIEITTRDSVKVGDKNTNCDDIHVVENIKINESSKGEDETGLEVMKPDQQDESYRSNVEEFPHVAHEAQEDGLFTKELVMEEQDSHLSVHEVKGLDSSQQSESTGQSSYTEVKSKYKKGKMAKSLSLDDAEASVASEFLSMLGIEHSPFGLSSDSDPESPRTRLLKQFEEDSLAAGGGIFSIDTGKKMCVELVDDSVQLDLGNLSDEFELSSLLHAAEAEHQKVAQAMKGKTRAKILEDSETEALMREWGLNENSFQSSAPGSADGFGSPIDLPPEEQFNIPPLGEGLGPFVQTKDGGFLRSMNLSLFKHAKNSGTLIMQVSSPVVVPAEMGSGIMEILQGLASVGIEKLSMQVSKLMPLEDITGKTMQQVAWEAAPAVEARERQDKLLHLKSEWPSEVRQHAFGGRKRDKGSSTLSSSVGGNLDSEYVTLEDLAPLAMDKIEALSMEGLRIQSSMSDEEAPSNISSQSFGEISALAGLRAESSGSLGLEGAAGLQLMDVKDGSEDVDGLMGLSITLDEWMRLDAGIVDEEEQNSSHTSRILAAHHASCTDLASGRWKGDKRGGKGSGRCGLFGNHFTVALMVQLRDPLRNYEPVGTPMLALIQVERVFIPPKPKIYHNVSLNGNSEEADDEPERPVLKEEKKEEEEAIPQFKITEAHVAGLKTEPGKKKLWGTKTQQQSGSRWLLANGMGKSNKHPFMKSKAITKSPQMTTTVQLGDTLWSISSRVHGTGAKWKELAALNPHIRNPNVIFPNETIKLR